MNVLAMGHKMKKSMTNLDTIVSILKELSSKVTGKQAISLAGILGILYIVFISNQSDEKGSAF